MYVCVGGERGRVEIQSEKSTDGWRLQVRGSECLNALAILTL